MTPYIFNLTDDWPSEPHEIYTKQKEVKFDLHPRLVEEYDVVRKVCYFCNQKSLHKCNLSTVYFTLPAHLVPLQGKDMHFPFHILSFASANQSVHDNLDSY